MAGKSADGARYVIDKELARGGMGAILRAYVLNLIRITPGVLFALHSRVGQPFG